MIDLGDPVVLTVTCTDATGALVDAGPTLTIGKPDGTTATPTVPTRSSLGVYTFTYTATQAGRFTVYWQATGVSISAYDNTFLVVQPGGLLISLEEAKASLRLPANQTVDDEDLRSLVAGCRGPMEFLCGPIVPRVCNEWHDGGGPTIMLLEAPVISITSITENLGAGAVYTLTNQVLDGGGSFDAYGYTADLDIGEVERRYSGNAGLFMPGRRNIHVSYIAGRAVMPPNLQRATRRLVRWLWQSEMQGQRPNGSRPEQVTYTEAGYAIPNAVIQLCAGEKRTAAVG